MDLGSGEDVIGQDSLARHNRTGYLAAAAAVAAVMAALGFVFGQSRAAPDGRPEDGAAAGAFLSCNDALPGRRLNVNLSWGQPSDSVTLATGDGRVIELDPSISDSQRLSEAVRHRYAAAGRYEVTLTSRTGSTEAAATCVFTASS